MTGSKPAPSYASGVPARSSEPSEYVSAATGVWTLARSLAFFTPLTPVVRKVPGTRPPTIAKRQGAREEEFAAVCCAHKQIRSQLFARFLPRLLLDCATLTSGFVLPFVLVGLLWGATNPLIRRGTLLVERKAVRQANGAPGARHRVRSRLEVHLTTPAFLVPQLLNLSGSVLFWYLLRQPGALLSLAVPVANGTSILANAVADWAVEPVRAEVSVQYLCGVACLLAGVLLCSE